ncbi:MAG: M23 family metallopeptidase [Bacteroidales bacterium]|nr:M23 family metallopeptidase [Bacteroidales bacterium]
MKKKYTYRFNPHTLSYEKVELTLLDRVKKICSTLGLGVVIGVLFAFLAFHFIDSPKERMMEADINQYRRALNSLNRSVDRCNKVLADIEERDSAVYRTIFGAKPVNENKRRPAAADYSKLEGRGSSKLVISTKLRVDSLEQRLYAQSLSLDEIYKMAGTKEQRMACMPAILPIKKNQCTIVSGFGMRYHPILHYRRMHTGIDLTAAAGTPIYATGNGTVTKAGRGGMSGYGVAIVINHGYGFQTLYAHLLDVKVREGQKVKRGDLIGTVGRSGLASGYHLHYEVIQNGNKVNPVYFLFNDLSPEEYDNVLEAAELENQCLS